MCVKPFTPEYDRCVSQLAHYTRLIASGDAPAITWLYRGGCLQNMRDLRGATRDYERALARAAELTPAQLAQVYDSRGVSRRQIDDLAGAIADGEQAVAYHPQHARYYSNLGQARARAGDLVGAIADFNRAIALDATEDWATGYRGHCQQQLGHHEQAIADFSHLIDLSPLASYQLLLNRAYSHMMLDHFGEAIADCDTAARRAEAEDYRIYLVRGYCCFRLGDLPTALGDFARGISLNRDLGELHLYRGLVYRAIGDETAAADDLAEFVALHSGGAAKAIQEIAYAAEALSPIPAMMPSATLAPALAD